jgi:mono/diheme cytochrome c family protein
MLRIKIGRRAGVGLVMLAFMAALAAPAAFGHSSLTPAPLIGAKPATKAQLAAGKAAFTANCSACHTLKAAGAVGNIGPVLDKVSLPEATFIKAITKGGSSVMTKAAIAKYTTTMVAYGTSIPKLTINEIAAYIYSVTHK